MKIISRSEKETLATGKVIARYLRKGDILCLFGQLGSGKTVLTKGIAQGMGITKSKVISPSFVLIRQYASGGLPLYHFDLYRLEAGRNIIMLGYEEYLYGEGVSVIEWAQRLGALLPAEHLKIELRIHGRDQRCITLSGRGKHYRELLHNIDEDSRH
jgi:tRNA threonylcarbamoyladenosine biosynthesis protein TsaE